MYNWGTAPGNLNILFKKLVGFIHFLKAQYFLVWSGCHVLLQTRPTAVTQFYPVYSYRSAGIDHRKSPPESLRNFWGFTYWSCIPFPPVFFCCSWNHDKCDQLLIHSERVGGGGQLPLLGGSESSDLWTRGLTLSVEEVVMFLIYYSELFSVEWQIMCLMTWIYSPLLITSADYGVLITMVKTESRLIAEHLKNWVQDELL